MNISWKFLLLAVFLLCNVIAKKGNLPMIFILGAQKGGSSSLFEFILEHPTLCQGVHKEPHFFDDPKQYGWTRPLRSGRWEPGKIPPREEYLDLFPDDADCFKKHIQYRYIDATTMLHASTQAMRAVHDFYTPEERNLLKFIVVLREPVSRDYSWFQQVSRDKLGGNPNERGGGGDSPQPFISMETLKEADAHHSRHIKRSGVYVEQLTNITKYFRRDQLFVVSSNMLFRNTSMVMMNLAKYLAVEDIPKWREKLPHDDHLGKKQWVDIVECMLEHIPKLDCSHRDVLGSYYAPFNEQLYSWLSETRSSASPFEPPFLPFGEDYKKISCVADARKEFNELIEKDNTTSCNRAASRAALRRLRE